MKIPIKATIKEAGKWVKVIIIVAFLVLLVVFLWENRRQMEVDFIFGTAKMPVSVLVLALFIIGLGLGFVMGKAKRRRKE